MKLSGGSPRVMTNFRTDVRVFESLGRNNEDREEGAMTTLGTKACGGVCALPGNSVKC